jgi:hypothetical protein
MSAPASSPAVVTVGPNSRFSTGSISSSGPGGRRRPGQHRRQMSPCGSPSPARSSALQAGGGSVTSPLPRRPGTPARRPPRSPSAASHRSTRPGDRLPGQQEHLVAAYAHPRPAPPAPAPAPRPPARWPRPLRGPQQPHRPLQVVAGQAHRDHGKRQDARTQLHRSSMVRSSSGPSFQPGQSTTWVWTSIPASIRRPAAP